jgi:hypothetical protein
MTNNTDTDKSWDATLTARYGDKLLKKPDATASTADPGGETEAQIAERVRTEEAQRVRDVTAICDLAGKPDRATAFVGNGTTVSAALAVLTREANAEQRSQRAR